MNTSVNESQTRGVHHVGLTVPNLDTTRKFFVNTLGYEQVGEIAEYPAAFLSDGNTMITLWQAQDPVSAVAFDRRKNIGLHHLAINVEDDAALDHLHERLHESDSVLVEFPPEPLLGGPTRHMMCYIPGGIRIEFIAAAS